MEFFIATALFFGILFVVAMVKSSGEAEDRKVFNATGKCPRCKGNKFTDSTVQHQLKGTTSHTDIFKVCQKCGKKIKLSTSMF